MTGSKLILAFVCVVVVSAHPGFRDLIPNGWSVPNPCPGTFDFWEGVGHNVAKGGGPGNLFGMAFIAANTTWTKTLCMADSDGDGFPNGQELGDPNCVWVKGGSDPQFKAIGHPGVCSPMFTTACDKYNVNITCY